MYHLFVAMLNYLTIKQHKVFVHICVCLIEKVVLLVQQLRFLYMPVDVAKFNLLILPLYLLYILDHSIFGMDPEYNQSRSIPLPSSSGNTLHDT